MRRIAFLLASVTLVALLASGVALAVTKQCPVRGADKCVGTQENDRLLGTWRGDWMVGRGGNDTLKGFDGGDYLYGSRGNDRLVGGYGINQFRGGPGRDTLQGGPHPDDYFFTSADWGKDTIIEPGDEFVNVLHFGRLSARLVIDMNPDPDFPEVRTADGSSTVNWNGSRIEEVLGSQGDDSVTGVADGYSSIEAAGGDDVIRVDDGDGLDVVRCGGGTDTVFHDPDDEVSGCEVQKPPTG